MYANTSYHVAKSYSANIDTMEAPVDTASKMDLLTTTNKVEYIRSLSGTYFKRRVEPILPQNWPNLRHHSIVFEKKDQGNIN